LTVVDIVGALIVDEALVSRLIGRVLSALHAHSLPATEIFHSTDAEDGWEADAKPSHHSNLWIFESSLGCFHTTSLAFFPLSLDSYSHNGYKNITAAKKKA
jgi:hypothetical protein